jgi:hypothetical protein
MLGNGYVGRRQSRKQLAAPARTCEENVQAPFPTLTKEWSKSPVTGIRLSRSVTQANKDDVSLVPLHVFQVFYKEEFVLVGIEELL